MKHLAKLGILLLLGVVVLADSDSDSDSSGSGERKNKHKATEHKYNYPAYPSPYGYGYNPYPYYQYPYNQLQYPPPPPQPTGYPRILTIRTCRLLRCLRHRCIPEHIHHHRSRSSRELDRIPTGTPTCLQIRRSRNSNRPLILRKAAPA